MPRNREDFLTKRLAERGTELEIFKDEAAQLRMILIDLFAPAGHKDGCLFKDNPNLPCQCGASVRIGRYKAALSRARKIAAAHDYENDFRDDYREAG